MPDAGSVPNRKTTDVVAVHTEFEAISQHFSHFNHVLDNWM